jgi:hypothetical protein
MPRSHKRFRAVTAALLFAVVATWSGAALSQSGSGSVHLPFVSGGQRAVASPTPGQPSPTPAPIVTATSQPQSWIFCANQFSGCTFSGLRTVRFGANGVYVYADHFEGLFLCNGEHMGSVPNVANPRCEYASEMKYVTIAGPSADNHSTQHVAVNLARIPAGHAGHDTLRVRNTEEQPVSSPDGVGAFRTVCKYSHMAFDDPIVYPGQAGRSHLHMFFGNKGANANSTAESLANSGRSTCLGGIANRSAYWTPALIDTRTGTPLAPHTGVWYYKTGYGGINFRDIRPMPRGLRMLAGNMNASSREQASHQGWDCSATSIPNLKTIPTSCPPGERISFTIHFPQCWDGVNLDSADHRSHMAYAENGCPTSHPVALPQITLNVYFDIADPTVYPHLRLSSDMYDTSIRGGWSLHADWFDGWNQSIKEQFVRNCPGKPADCHAHLLGDDQEMY